MGREAVVGEMEELLGTVLAELDRVPDELVDAEWQVLRRSLFDETLIPGRYRALIGVGVAAALRCPYATRLHTELARVQGASDAELAEAVHHAGVVCGSSTRMTGLELDLADFAAEVAAITGHFANRIGVEL